MSEKPYPLMVPETRNGILVIFQQILIYLGQIFWQAALIE